MPMQPLQPAWWMRPPALTRSREQPLRDQVLQHLPRGGVDVEGHAVVDLPAADHLRRDREVAVAGVGRGADVGLVDVLARHLPHRHHLAGAGRLGDQRLEPGEVDLLVQVVARAVVGEDLHPVRLAALLAQERAGRRVRGEDGGGRAQLGAHVGDDVAVHRAQALQARAVVLDDPAEAALHAVPPQHLQDHVLGAGPRRAGCRSAARPRSAACGCAAARRPWRARPPRRRRRRPACRASRPRACGCPSPAAACPARRSAPCARGG